MPLSDFRLSVVRFPSNCKAVSRPSYSRVDGQQEATYENPSNALIAGREQLSGNGEESEKAIWSVAGF